MRLETWVPEDIHNLHIGYSIDLAVINETKNKITFPYDYGIRILSYDEKSSDWNEISNGIGYGFPTTPQVAPKGDDGVGVITVYPEVENNNKSIDIRVVIIGTTTYRIIPISKQVGAYIDLTLQP